jgi:hypothetical protein
VKKRKQSPFDMVKSLKNKRQKPGGVSSAELGPLLPVNWELDAYLQRTPDLFQPNPFRLPRQQKPVNPLLPKKRNVQPQLEIVRFANRQDARILKADQPLDKQQLVKDLNKIANSFRHNTFFRDHVSFPELYQKAFIGLSQYDVKRNLPPSERERCGITARALEVFWESYFRVNAATDAIDYFASVEISNVLLKFFETYDVPWLEPKQSGQPEQELSSTEERMIQEKASLFSTIADFLIMQGYIVPPPGEPIFTLSNYGLTRVLRQFCLFIDDFYRANQQKYVSTPSLSCEVAGQMAQYQG